MDQAPAEQDVASTFGASVVCHLTVQKLRCCLIWQSMEQILAVREILGGHVSHLQSVIRYSRDALGRAAEGFVSHAVNGYSGGHALCLMQPGRDTFKRLRHLSLQAMPVAPDTVEISDEEVVKVELPEPVTFSGATCLRRSWILDSSSDEDGVS